MKWKFTSATRIFGLFADVFDFNAITPKIVYKLKYEMHCMQFVHDIHIIRASIVQAMYSCTVMLFKRNK